MTIWPFGHETPPRLGVKGVTKVRAKAGLLLFVMLLTNTAAVSVRTPGVLLRI